MSTVKPRSKPSLVTAIRQNLRKPTNKQKPIQSVVQGYDLKQVDKGGNNVLHEIPIYIGDSPELIQFFVDQGVDVNQRNNRNSTPLHVAVETSAIDTAKILLTAGADHKVIDKEGMIPRDYLQYEDNTFRQLLNTYL